MKVLIVDDEALARAKLRRLLAGLPGVELVGEASGGREALQQIRATSPDVVFLDIDMADLNGFDVVAALGDSPPLVVFATAYDAFALRAFDVHAVDYLLKPFDAERLGAAVERARERLGQRIGNDRDALAAVLEEIRAHRDLLARAADSGAWAERLMVRRGHDLVPLAVETIDWIGAADNYVEVHVGRESHLLRETLQSVERHLDPRRFARIHRGTIVNRDRVRAVRMQASGELAIELDSGALLPVGRSYRARVSARWQTVRPEGP
jgi:two-component system LytT family response regulator